MPQDAIWLLFGALCSGILVASFFLSCQRKKDAHPNVHLEGPKSSSGAFLEPHRCPNSIPTSSLQYQFEMSWSRFTSLLDHYIDKRTYNRAGAIKCSVNVKAIEQHVNMQDHCAQRWQRTFTRTSIRHSQVA